jgi:hypothetical protein
LLKVISWTQERRRCNGIGRNSEHEKGPGGSGPTDAPADPLLWSPYRHQAVSRHLEFGCGHLDGGGLVSGLNIAQPDGFAGDLIEAPDSGLGGSDPLAMRQVSTAR